MIALKAGCCYTSDMETNHKYYIRCLHQDECPVIGEVLPVSARWDDGDRTDEDLVGTCAWRIIADCTLDLIREYGYEWGRYAIISGADVGDAEEGSGSVLVADACVETLGDWAAITAWLVKAILDDES